MSPHPHVNFNNFIVTPPPQHEGQAAATESKNNHTAQALPTPTPYINMNTSGRAVLESIMLFERSRNSRSFCQCLEDYHDLGMVKLARSKDKFG